MPNLLNLTLTPSNQLLPPGQSLTQQSVRRRNPKEAFMFLPVLIVSNMYDQIILHVKEGCPTSSTTH